MIVLRSAPDTDWQYTYHVELHVAIDDPEILDDQPICILLSKFAEKAEEVCQNIEEIVNSGGK